MYILCVGLYIRGWSGSGPITSGMIDASNLARMDSDIILKSEFKSNSSSNNLWGKDYLAYIL